MEQALTKALAELRQGLEATKRMLLARCELREDDDGKFRSIREPLPTGALAAAKAAKATTVMTEPNLTGDDRTVTVPFPGSLHVS
jgi:hypothetical protein